MPTKKAAKTIKGVSLAPVDDYPENGDNLMSDEDVKRIENRPEEDQIVDYHKNNPPTDTSGPEHDPEVHRQLLSRISPAADAAPPVVTHKDTK